MFRLLNDDKAIVMKFVKGTPGHGAADAGLGTGHRARAQPRTITRERAARQRTAVANAITEVLQGPRKTA
jgi:hypothetical protein